MKVPSVFHSGQWKFAQVELMFNDGAIVRTERHGVWREFRVLSYMV